MIGIETWSPPGAEDGDGPSFTFRHGTVIERNMLEAEAAGRYRAGEVPVWQLHQAFADGVVAILGDGDDAQHLAGLSLQRMTGEPLSPADQAVFDQAAIIIADRWPAYGALVQQQANRDAIIPTLAFRRFVTGWSGVTDRTGDVVEFATGADACVADAALRRIEPWHVLLLGLRIFHALYARGEEKNLEPRSKSGSAQPISPTARRKAAAGKLAQTSGRKTRR